MAKKEDVAEIRRLNDQLRKTWRGGRVVLTCGMQEVVEETLTNILLAVASFDAFTPDNDPYGEHDCAILEVEGHSVLFKIDYYDKQMSMGSENPADPNVTTRVLTIMKSSEY